jgi:hypothetical protein
MELDYPEAGRSRRLGQGLFLVVTLVATVALAAATLGAGLREARAAEPASPTGASPLLLLNGPGWRIQNTEESRGRSREGISGSIEFVTGKPIPYESIKVSGPNDHPHESGMFPPAVRQRRVELAWRPGSLKQTIAWIHGLPHPHGRKVVKLAVMDTTAYVDTHNEFYANQGGPGNRQMIALWSDRGDVFELRAAVPDLGAFEERLGWLTKVDQQTWLEALPPKVVAPAEYEHVVHDALKGIPLPHAFRPSRVPDEGLVTDRYQVGARTAGTVSCLWLRQWGAARRSGDTGAELEADKAMATSRHWPILREMTREGAYSEVVWEIAKWMPKGYFEWNGHKRDLLAHAEGLGCANFGLPLLPEKMKINHERESTASI